MIRITDEGIVIEGLPEGPRAMVIDAEPEGPVILLFHADGRPAGGLAFSPIDGELVCTLVDVNGVVRTGIKIQDGAPIVCTFDAEGNPLSGRRLEDPPATALDLVASQN